MFRSRNNAPSARHVAAPTSGKPWWGKKLVASIATVAVIAAMTVVGAQVAQAADSAPISVSKTGPSYAAPGQTITYVVTLENKNPKGGAALYNVTLADLLPEGLTYVAGSTRAQQPYNFGDPSQSVVKDQQTPPQPTGDTSLQWGNVMDLAAGQ